MKQEVTHQEKSNSFSPLWAGNFKSHIEPFFPSEDEERRKINPPPSRSYDSFVEKKDTAVHTLILGTHPGQLSLEKLEYFKNPLNAFWWIVGDNLGFRRDKGETKNGSKRFKLCSSLKYDDDKILSYPEQVEKLVHSGFALWDMVKNCERAGSSDSNITNATYNDIRSFVMEHATIEKIVFSSGKSSCNMFLTEYKDWVNQEPMDTDIEEPILVPYTNEMSQNVFKKKLSHRKYNPDTSNFRIVYLVCLPSPSAAHATLTYEEKCSQWTKYCFSFYRVKK